MNELFDILYIAGFLALFGTATSLTALFVWKFKPTRKLINKYIGEIELF